MTNKRKFPDTSHHQKADNRAKIPFGGRPGSTSSPGPSRFHIFDTVGMRSPSEEPVVNAFGKPEVLAKLPAAEYILSNSGNLYIQLTVSKSTVVRYLVLAETLRLASTFWSNLMDPRSPQFRVEQRRLAPLGAVFPFLDVHGDDPEAMLCFLRIVHMETEKIPRKLEFEQLKSIALLCDKYDCVKALGLWREHWVNQFPPEHRLTKGYEDWLAVDAIFGNEKQFLQLMQAIVRESRLSEADEYGVRHLFRNSTKLCGNGNGNIKREASSEDVIAVESKDCIPPDVMVEIHQLREEMITNLFAVGRKFANFVLQASSDESSPNRRNYECKESCMAMAYGCFARSAERNKVMRLVFAPKHKVSQLQETPAELFDRLRNIQFRIPSQPRLCERERQDCGLRDLQADYYRALEYAFKITTEVGKYMKFREEKQWSWETIDLSNQNSIPIPAPSFEHRMNHGLQQKRN